MLPLLLYVGVPAALALVLWRAEEAVLTRKRARLSRSMSEGVELKVRVAEGAAERVSLGSSVETPESISATPMLTTGEVVLVEEPFDDADGPAPTHVRAGRRLALVPGASMEIAGLPGARRKPLDIETTESGVVHHYSFELAPDKVFWISGLLQAPEPGGPFRGDVTWQLAPLSEGRAYVASATRGARTRTDEESGLGPGAALLIAAVIAGVSFVPDLGPLLWVIGVGLMALLVGAELSAARTHDQVAVPPDTRSAPAARVALPADPEASDEAAELEAAAEEPPAGRSRK